MASADPQSLPHYPLSSLPSSRSFILCWDPTVRLLSRIGPYVSLWPGPNHPLVGSKPANMRALLVIWSQKHHRSTAEVNTGPLTLPCLAENHRVGRACTDTRAGSVWISQTLMEKALSFRAGSAFDPSEQREHRVQPKIAPLNCFSYALSRENPTWQLQGNRFPCPPLRWFFSWLEC